MKKRVQERQILELCIVASWNLAKTHVPQKKAETRVDLLVLYHHIYPFFSILNPHSAATLVTLPAQQRSPLPPVDKAPLDQPPSSSPRFSSFYCHGDNSSSNSPREWPAALPRPPLPRLKVFISFPSSACLWSWPWLGQLRRPTVPSASASCCSTGELPHLPPISRTCPTGEPAPV